MSALKYRYGHRSSKHRPRKVLVVFACSLLIVGAIACLVVLDLRGRVSPVVEGESRSVAQVLTDSTQKLSIDEPFFTMELPADWKEISRRNDSNENSITWQSTKKGEENRTLVVYIDKIPADRAINKLLPVTPQGNTLTTGDISELCSTFTGGGSLEASRTSELKPTPAKWQGVDFICNLPRFTDNEIGTGSRDSLNSVSVTGATAGTHKYFFLYTDRNIQPKNNIFYEAIQSFRAK